MPDNPFTYEKSGRRPVTWAALVFMCLMLVIAWIYRAPWDIWALWVLAIAGLVYMLLRNPKYGMRLDDETLTYWTRGPEKQLALADIDQVEFRPVSDSSYVTIHLKSGDSRRVFSDAFPHVDRAVEALSARGIRTTRE
jgi:hypothetical protein